MACNKSILEMGDSGLVSSLSFQCFLNLCDEFFSFFFDLKILILKHAKDFCEKLGLICQISSPKKI
jgi:hypothetical protein